MSKTKVSVVICTYNRYDLLPKAIASLQTQSGNAGEFEIIVVDNSPDHDFSNETAKDFATIRNLRWIVEKKPGLSNARNVGIKASQGDVVAFMDDDAIADARWVETIAATFGKLESDVGIIGGRVDPIWHSPRPSWLDDELLIYVSVIDWPGRMRDLKPQEWLAGTNIAYRKAALEEIGGFSTGLGRIGGEQSLLSNDETEVAEKLAALGFRTKYVPKMRMDHVVEQGRLKQSWFRRRIAWQAVSDYLKDPKGCFEKAEHHWTGVTWHFSKLPPSQKNPGGFVTAEPDPAKFKDQLGAIYSMTLASLAGFDGVSMEPL